jgi:type IV pilus assembly protein PilC
MTSFSYDAISKTNGANSSGVVEADSAEAARTMLKGQGLMVVELREGRAAMAQREFKLGGDKVKLKDVAWAARNLATTQQAGLPIPRALKMLAYQRREDGIGKTLLRVHDDVINGRSLGEAFGQEEERLGRLTTAMVQAGEQSGKLNESLGKLADLCEARVRLKRKIVSAMTYPTVMVGLVGMIFMVMLLVVVPTFKAIYEQIDGEMPGITAFMMALSDFLRGHFLLVGVSIVPLFFGFKALKKNVRVLEFKDRIVLKLPILGPLFLSSVVARLATTMASSLGAGVPLLDSLQLSADVAGNSVFSVALIQVREDVRNGKSLGQAMAKQPAIPEMFTSLVMIGEETGQLDGLLIKYSEIIEEEVETKVEALTSIIEPLMIVAFGGLVGVMVIALYLPLINIFKFLK